MIELRDVAKQYRMGSSIVHALRGVSLRIDDGDFVAIMGPSGSGKSTLAHILGLLDAPTSGSYRLGGQEVSGLSEDALARLRGDEIGFIFQQFNLLPRLSAEENVSLPLFYAKSLSSGADAEVEGGARALALLDLVGLGDRADHRPNELSGGQQQRVAIARALVNRPRVILADEPTGNLDSKSEREILAVLRGLNQQGITVVMVTHEEEVGAQANRLIRMRDGEIQSDVRNRPLSNRPLGGSNASADASAGLPAAGQPLAATPAHSASAHDHGPAHSRLGGRALLSHFDQGFRALTANKVRTFLSILGILIGVAAVVAMLALGRGAQKAIEEQISSLGSNLLILRNGAVRVGGVMQETGATTRLTLEDVEAVVDQVPDIKLAAATVNGRGQVTYANKNWSTTVLGAGAAYADMHAQQPQLGRFFTADEDAHRARVAAIGLTVARELFGDQNPIGEFIKINKVNFQVIGVLPEKGNNGWRDQDDIVIVPVSTAMRRLMGKLFIDSADLQMKTAEATTTAQDEIKNALLARKRVPPSMRDDAFVIRNMADIQSALSESGKTMSALLASVAAISLLVGGIGIMNIMLVSVTERTKEIGLRKALGARRSDILVQFLVESVAVSLVGGAAGVLSGWAITMLLSAMAGWATSISLSATLLAFGFSAGIGVLFGLYPAKRASALHPIEALRYE